MGPTTTEEKVNETSDWRWKIGDMPVRTADCE